MEDYAGRACLDGSSNCVQTIAQMITYYNKGGKTSVHKGVDVESDDTSDIIPAL